MKVLEVPVNAAYTHDDCAHCGRKIRAGEWIVAHRILDATLYVRFTAHVDCLRQAMSDAPDATGVTFEQAGEELLALRETI